MGQTPERPSGDRQGWPELTEEYREKERLLAEVVRKHPERAEEIINDLYAKGWIARTPDGYSVPGFPEIEQALSEHHRRGHAGG